MKNKQLPLQDKLELFRAIHQKRNNEIGGKHLGSRPHLKATRKFYGQVLREYGKSPSMEDQMILESIRDGRKSINSKLDPNWLKRNTKAFVRWTGRQLQKAGKAVFQRGKEFNDGHPNYQKANVVRFKGPQMTKIMDLPGIRASQTEVGKKLIAGGNQNVVPRKKPAATVQLNRSVARSTSRQIKQDTPRNGMSMS
ncbi:hypothetical protein [Chitinophaga barathri]|uniref:Uncharacterized protein n=1 Tax=Chitinophaga barathri TaxID=1647451 RepID=A0A3N4N621_9BACT|nr:hypothetical protein [Chitinophaga barathri]RPD43083.1 hypothetical protein EG028_01970 [Chitinophaga barathri]